MENQTAGQHYANRPGSLVRTLILMPAACIVYKPSILPRRCPPQKNWAAKAVADAAAVTRAFTVVGHFPAAFFFPEPVSNRPAALSARPLWRPSWYPAYYIRSFFGMGAGFGYAPSTNTAISILFVLCGLRSKMLKL